MSYAIRNTLIITGFWAILLAAGIYWVFGHQNKVHTNLLKEKASKAKKLEELEYLETSRNELSQYLERLIQLDEGQKGVLVSSETPGESFDYLVRELERSGSGFQFDLKNKGKVQRPKVVENQYEIVGDGTFLEAYRLLWFLENGPAFYRVDGVDIKRLEKKDFEYGSYANNAEVTMVLKITSYQRKGGPEIKTLAVEEDRSLDLANLFTSSGVSIKPLRKPENTRRTVPARSYSPNVANRVTQPKKNTTGLPEIDSGTKVLALTPSWVMIQTKDGKKIKLTIGQKVFQGYLNEIRTDSNEAVFKINRGAVPEDFVLSVAYQKRRY